MPKLLFAWLGSGRTKRPKVGDRGRMLDQAARAGLPVPPGAVLLDEFYRFALANDLITRTDGYVVCTDPFSLHATIFDSLRLPRFDRPVIVRAIDDHAGDPADSPAVNDQAADTQNAAEFGRALTAAWTELEFGDANRHDVLLIEAVPAMVSGSAVSLLYDECDHITYVATQSVAHSAADAFNERPQSVGRLAGWSLPDDALPPATRRLQMLMRGVRRTMGQGDWLVNWADDGAICWITELRQLSGSQP